VEEPLEKQVRENFRRYFASESCTIYSAPGRVNLIGEHTDYNDGFVLPAAINFHTLIAAETREDRIIKAVALDEGNTAETPSIIEFSLDQRIEKDKNAPWSNYLRGVVQELLAADFTLCGANLVISGNVPRGAGLSSSAALENVITLALTSLSRESIDGVKAAQIGQAAENNFVGCRCGIMDQMVSAVGQKQCALLLDCRSLQTRAIPLPNDCALIVINSNVKRGLVDSQYNTRREQCEQAANFFKVSALRDVSLDMLRAKKSQLDPVVYKRALHVVSENARTRKATQALREADHVQLGKLMYDSHASMKNDFEITVPAIDTLVDIVRDVIGDQGGVRMTGGGFGGCVVALVPKSLEQTVITAVRQHYPSQTGLSAEIYRCETSDGAFWK